MFKCFDVGDSTGRLGERVIRTLLALDGALIRGAVAFVLDAQHDIDVVAEVDHVGDLGATIRSTRPDIVVTCGDLLQPEDWRDHDPSVFGRTCALLVLVDSRRVAALSAAFGSRVSSVGFLSNDATPEQLIEAVRRLARGESVLDPDLVVAALTRTSPLTSRELEVLGIAAQGWPVAEIAAKLGLSPGTIRNHLSRITGKAGARTRIEAVRIAREAGWI
jgi:two-component system response regulator DesR